MGRVMSLTLVQKIWDILTNDYKTVENLDTFKIKIKKWKSENCPCRLCKADIDRVSFYFFKKVKSLNYF